MNAEQRKVREFHEKFGAIINDFPQERLDSATEALRVRLVMEEAEEFRDATTLEKKMDALADLLVVVYGSAVSYGVDLQEVFDEVHSSNMSKLGADGKPIMREDGKVLKGPDYFPPNIARIIKLQRWSGYAGVLAGEDLNETPRACKECGMVGTPEEVSIHRRLGCDAL